ncbi:MAG: mechanosensitive ion channel domain-containing protein, partial [Thermoguttaceae bacterium]
LTVEVVQNRLKETEASPTLDDASKGKLRELYQQALQDLESAKTWTASTRRSEQMAATAPDELARTKSELASLPRQSTASVPDASLVQLEQSFSQKSAELAAAKTQLAELEAEPKRRATRRLEIPKLVAAARENLAQAEAQLQSLVTAADSSELAGAKRLALAARRQTLEQEVLSLQTELKTYDVRAELLPLRRDLAAGQVALAEQELARWQEAINHRRQRDAEDQLRRAKQEAQEAHPALADLTRQNAELAERRKSLAQLIVGTSADLEQAAQQLASLEDQFKRTRDKVDAVGQTNAIGLLLRKQRQAMPDVRTRARNIRLRQPVMQECQLELLQFDDRRTDLADLEAQIQKELASAEHGVDSGSQYELEWAARRALETEKEYLDALIVDLNSYFDKLIDLDNTERQLTQKTEEYIKYIDERVLWIRSTSALDLASLRHVGQAVAWLLQPESWLELAGCLSRDARKNLFRVAFAAAVFLLLVWGQRRLRQRLNDVGRRAELANCGSLLPTMEALGLTAGLSGVIPGILWYLAWRLNVQPAPSTFCSAAAAALTFTAGAYLVLDLLEKQCRRNGLADSHFDWPASALRPIRHYVRLAKVIVLPLMFVVVTMDSQPNDRWGDSLGRVCFIGAMVAFAVLLQRSLRPRGPLYQALLATQRDAWSLSFRIVWYPVIILLPVALALLAATGYYYTAQQLSGRMLTGGYVLLGLMLSRSLLLRWVLVRRRKLAIHHARQRRAAAQNEAASAGNESGMSPAMITSNEPKLDLATINVQTRRFVEYSLALAGILGMWFVWVDVLPALRVFDKIALWHGDAQAEWTSLADVSLAALIFATALTAAKNAPGLLEMVLLQRLPLDAGVRYTIATVLRYIIGVVGILVSCHMIGLTWNTVQWLVAAISVGLGFGLQEIFANFVSGLIILFERPVRVGDIVTVADTTGVISRIRMRATTITNWDRQEFIVPNKEFITGRLLNWTLSDKVNRVVVKVGIAYGSDTVLATDLMLTIAQEHPLILKEPAPRVAFEEFGASSLNYVLRCFLPDMENRLQVVHELHIAIDREFRRAGIEIAFPQQDIHVRSIHADPELLEQILAGTGRAPEDTRGRRPRQVA